MTEPYLHPILSCEQAMRLERALLPGQEHEWQAMCRAGSALALAMLGDWQELCGRGWYWNGQDGGCRSQQVASPQCEGHLQTSQKPESGPVDYGSGACGQSGSGAAEPVGPRLLVLVGKGHNGGDALLAAAAIANRFTHTEIVLYRTQPLEALRPHCRRAWDGLLALVAERPGLRLRDASARPPQALFEVAGAPYAFCIDGLLGMQSRPPLRGKEAAVLEVVNNAGARIGLRAAVDLPSGLGDANAFRADFTYATGIAKHPAFIASNSGYVGRLRCLDIGFFDSECVVSCAGAAKNAAVAEACAVRERVIMPTVLDAFRNWRSPFKDKRHYGHLFVLGGSAQMPGALLMNVQAALRSGAGLVTAFAPQSVAHVFAAQAPEAMWVPWPETEEGTLALEGQHLLAERLGRATALLMGSGMGRSAETLALLEDIARTCDVPLVLDADALRPSVLAAAARYRCHSSAVAVTGANTPAAQAFAGGRPVVITPHAGEFMRLCPPASVRSAGLCGNGANFDRIDIDAADALRAFCAAQGVITVLKGPQTRVVDAQGVAYGLFGGPVLARGGSGDVLAGLVGGCLVQHPDRPQYAAQQAVCWHGLAAQALARACGQVSVTTMDLVHHLRAVIRDP